MEVDTMAIQGNRVGSGGEIGSGTSGSHRGFAGMDHAKQREIASKGGSASGGNFANNPERAAVAGRKGGEASRGGGNRNQGGSGSGRGKDGGGNL
jgi:hypothetical protein